MNTVESVYKRVAKFYHDDDINCATVTLKILSESFDIEINMQLLDAAVGMNGAGRYGGQCGLVEGTILFLGVFGRNNEIPYNVIIDSCRDYAKQFENNFGSLQCNILRPEGFHPDNPPHICEPFTCRAVKNAIEYVTALKKNKDNQSV